MSPQSTEPTIRGLKRSFRNGNSKGISVTWEMPNEKPFSDVLLWSYFSRICSVTFSRAAPARLGVSG